MKFRNNAIAAGVLIALGSVSGAMAQDESISTSTTIGATVKAYCLMEIDDSGLTNSEGFISGDTLSILPYVACNAFGGAQFTVSGTNGGFKHESSGTLIPYSVNVAVLDYAGTAIGVNGTIIDAAIGGNGGLAEASSGGGIVGGDVLVTVEGDTAYAGDYEETLGFKLSAIF